MDRIRIELLTVRNFRNYESLDCRFHPQFNVITGNNGAGKTSILDAIYYLTNGRSYFSYRDQYLYRHGEDYLRLGTKLFSGDEAFKVDINSSITTKKSIKLEDKAIPSIVGYVGRFPSFMIAPNDILILLDSSVERRKLIDRTLSQVDRVYFSHLLSYNKLLKQKNAALKQMRESGRQDLLLIESFNVKMSGPATYIHNKRKEYTSDIVPMINEFYKELSNDAEQIELNYTSQMNDSNYLDLQKSSAYKDIAAAKTLSGTHKDDIEITLNSYPIKKYASQGQLKSAIIAVKLAQLEYVRNITQKIPILLLDDIFDKLDKNRVQNFIKICHHKLKAQVFITDTDENRVEERLQQLDIDFSSFNIDNGQLMN